VLSCDEKSQIQALDRTQPSLPMKPGRCGTMTHDYKRNGTTSLFAAMNMIERFFRDLSERAIKRGSFYNVDDLIGAITEYINAHNRDPKPFIWTASATDILAKVKRARKALNK
jgi:hypothetical protein